MAKNPKCAITKEILTQSKLYDEPSIETTQAIREVETGIHSKRFTSVEDLMKDLESQK